MSEMENGARELAKFLTTRDQYGRKSPLDNMLEARITQIAREIAAEIVAATPELQAVIRRQVQDLVRKALLDEAYLSKTVIDAVARGLHKYVLDQEDDES